MKLLQHLISLLRVANRFLIGLLLTIGVSKHGKRLIFVVTLFAGLNKARETSLESLQTLNNKLGVTEYDAALEFPVLMAGRIWGDLTLDCVLGGECTGGRQCQSLCQEELARMADKVLSIMPKWMRYAPLETMLKDAEQVVQTNRALRTA